VGKEAPQDAGDWGSPAGAGYAREEAAVLDQRFARLPNPDLVMYVFPHLAPSGAPVPGYVTVLPMYERTQYALPGEIAPSARALDGGR
jgi:conjugative transfer region lipoprotein (TIGR03751 family)